MNVGRRVRRGIKPAQRPMATCEPLESRRLLSASVVERPGIVTHADTVLPAGDIQGYTPSQISTAYGFNQVSFNGGNTTLDGSGQTIAIVDPFNDPAVSSDLNIFDEQFNLPAPHSLQIVNDQGGSHLPPTNGGWAGEIATDVEWAHAMAPSANILLVEANSDSVDDLMNAVDYARHVKDVSVISLSWGGGEFAGQLPYDSMFQTPSGHQGVTVVVASGDNGAAGGAQWPATSQFVLSVGGTVLNTSDATGTYMDETSWSDSSGGVSQFETEPAWQKTAQATGQRTIPDVAYDADANVGLALYDSVPYQGVSGWQTTNGTSDGAPQWAAIVALADQARVLNNQSTLDGPSQVMPLLYSLYAAPGASGYSSYTNYFNDITVPQDPANPRGLPDVGYDLTSGLGSPKVEALVPALINASSSMTLSQPPASPITASILKPAKTSVISGTAGLISVKLTNSSTAALSQGLSINLTDAPDPTQPGNATQIDSLSLPVVTLAPHASKVFRVAVTWPSVSSPVTGYLVAYITPHSTATGLAAGESAIPVTVAAPFVTLAPSFVSTKPILINVDALTNVLITVKNSGNVIASGTLAVMLFDSSDQTLSSSDKKLAATPLKLAKLGPGRSATYRLSFIGPTSQIPGTYYLIASLQTTIVGDASATAVIATTAAPVKRGKG